jgi:hypothetical protein
MTGSIRAALLIGLAACGLASALPRVEVPASLLPEAAAGWKADGDDHRYDAETIFDYIDGAGEVYRAYNMKALLSRRFKQAGKPDIIADVFDMGSPADAYGVFTHDLDGERPAVGQDAVYKGGLLTFWRDKYFVSVFAEDENEETKAALLELGKKTATAIGRDGERQALLGALPAGWDDPRKVHFLHHPVILNYHFFVSAENVLGLDSGSEALLVKAAGRSALVVVRYAGPGQASAALEKWRTAFPARAADGKPVQGADKTWTASTLQGRTLIILFRAATAEAAASAVQAAAARIREKGL